MTDTIREGDNAVLVQHHCVIGSIISGDDIEGEDFGTYRTVVRQWSVSEVRRHAQYDRSVDISFTKLKKRRSSYFTLIDHGSDHFGSNGVPNDYVTIERDGRVLYDSRSDIPVNMEAFNATREKYRAQWRPIAKRNVA